ncbi:hypothetical protein GE061_002967 [Apolygus lucorum]|uniref:Uncharacterized protein n=1 Tax=Apolygus lucorum TaxID=248454 RepID=A0A6A4JEZ9_APOLU|nr:hypothetical protein GE061_002967 [Apolygus lucorum]
MEGDSDFEVVMVTEHVLTAKELRLKLLEALIQCPPPEPLHWTTFLNYVVDRFKSFYPEKIIKDVFHLVDRAITKKRYVSAVIDLDSDDEHTRNNDKGRENREPSSQTALEPISDTVTIDDSCNGNDEDLSLNIQNSTYSRENFEEFRRDSVVKNYAKLFKDVYSIMKKIEDSTTCRVCAKLRYRITKFQEMVSKESELVRATVNPSEPITENVCSSTRKVGRFSSTEEKENSYFEIMRSRFLTEEEAEKIREAILMDKLIELSYPDVLTSVASNPAQCDVANQEPRTPRKKKSKKSSRKSAKATLKDSEITSNNKKKSRNSEPDTFPLETTPETYPEKELSENTSKKKKRPKNSVPDTLPLPTNPENLSENTATENTNKKKRKGRLTELDTLLLETHHGHLREDETTDGSSKRRKTSITQSPSDDSGSDFFPSRKTRRNSKKNKKPRVKRTPRISYFDPIENHSSP